MKELNKIELEKQDFIDNSIFELLQSINPSTQEIEWNIEMIGEVRDIISDWFVNKLKLTTEREFYPFINE